MQWEGEAMVKPMKQTPGIPKVETPRSKTLTVPKVKTPPVPKP